ncbi:Minf_1886 family protein [Cephaloticoccus capnophilus]|uniref:Minf_1886 family protein n=1 Tax=Cephaloticoccus capnophilus TaxID=1548208 RepID=UPI0008399099|nr:Minf_1886 family protein [Cephaloticoccus capnophilus]
MPELNFPEIIELIYKEDTRYAKKAYDFVRLGLDYTVKELRKRDPKRAVKSIHVSGPELLQGMRSYALDQFGPLAKTVLSDWGITRCRDFGAIVYNLIEYNVFSKTPDDRLEDFVDLYSFDEAFTTPFLPSAKQASATAHSPADTSTTPAAAQASSPVATPPPSFHA